MLGSEGKGVYLKSWNKAKKLVRISFCALVFLSFNNPRFYRSRVFVKRICILRIIQGVERFLGKFFFNVVIAERKKVYCVYRHLYIIIG